MLGTTWNKSFEGFLKGILGYIRNVCQSKSKATICQNRQDI